ncbi:MAG: hypothetical protein J6V74_03495, partial [Bacteroidales bacterium]|nr:hypothetical protein [Bacteroidales bacterium]
MNNKKRNKIIMTNDSLSFNKTNNSEITEIRPKNMINNNIINKINKNKNIFHLKIYKKLNINEIKNNKNRDDSKHKRLINNNISIKDNTLNKQKNKVIINHTKLYKKEHTLNNKNRNKLLIILKKNKKEIKQLLNDLNYSFSHKTLSDNKTQYNKNNNKNKLQININSIKKVNYNSKIIDKKNKNDKSLGVLKIYKNKNKNNNSDYINPSDNYYFIN